MGSVMLSSTRFVLTLKVVDFAASSSSSGFLSKKSKGFVVIKPTETLLIASLLEVDTIRQQNIRSRRTKTPLRRPIAQQRKPVSVILYVFPVFQG